MWKRSFDVASAAVALVILWPLFLLIVWLIRSDDGGPVLFFQTRLGRHKRPFRIYKFRTMHDGGVTRVGHWLRATGLDELPQLWNVLRGDMSVIGPRPLTPADVARLHWDDQAHALRWRVYPGITGLAQLHAGHSARLSWRLDRRYVTSGGLILDAGIIVLSAAVTLLGKRRVRRFQAMLSKSSPWRRRCAASGQRPNAAPKLPLPLRAWRMPGMAQITAGWDTLSHAGSSHPSTLSKIDDRPPSNGTLIMTALPRPAAVGGSRAAAPRSPSE